MDIVDVNAHLHTPYSFSAFDSVSQALDMAVKEGVKVVGINDFYSMDGYREWSVECNARHLFPLFNIEFISLSTEDQAGGVRVNDPNNPGRTYLSGKGLAYPVILKGEEARKLAEVRAESNAQVERMCGKLNVLLDSVKAGFGLSFSEIRDNLTRGSVRERHLAKALRLAVESRYPSDSDRLSFYEKLFGGKPLAVPVHDVAAVENEKLGQRGETDMLCISVSPTDAIGHSFGTRGTENWAVYKQLDDDLAAFLKYLDRKVGRGQYLLFLTADHGAAHNSTMLSENRIPASGWNMGEARKALNEHLKAKFGLDNMAPYQYSYKVFLDRPGIKAAGLKLQDVVDEAIEFLKQEKDLLYVIDLAHAGEATVPAWLKEQLVNGWHSQRSGDIYCVTRSSYYDFKPGNDYRGTTHGAWNPYDSHIPCVFFGWKVRHGHSTRTTHMIDIAPTVCAMLRIQMPTACIGDPITEVSDMVQ